eukprot:PLAT3862.4.p2 GENE.PLAT3862.4~~PLAT3862.4.p2  ORF type:complete len:870 (-),score=400.77 PLAT3862.4:64-2640(-)
MTKTSPVRPLRIAVSRDAGRKGGTVPDKSPGCDDRSRMSPTSIRTAVSELSDGSQLFKLSSSWLRPRFLNQGVEDEFHMRRFCARRKQHLVLALAMALCCVGYSLVYLASGALGGFYHALYLTTGAIGTGLLIWARRHVHTPLAAKLWRMGLALSVVWIASDLSTLNVVVWADIPGAVDGKRLQLVSMLREGIVPLSFIGNTFFFLHVLAGPVGLTAAELTLFSLLLAGPHCLFVLSTVRQPQLGDGITLLTLFTVFSLIMNIQNSHTDRQQFAASEELLVRRTRGERALRALLAAEEARGSAARRAAETIRSFVAYIFHEVRVPFNALRLGVDELLHLPTQSEAAVEIESVMQEAADAMAKILDDVLDYSRLEEGQLQLAPQPMLVPSLVRSVIRMFMPPAADKAVTIAVNVDPALELQWVMGDAHRIRQVLSNYISNAIKFTPRKGRVDVTASMRPAEEESEEHAAAAAAAEALADGGSSSPRRRVVRSRSRCSSASGSSADVHTFIVRLAVKDSGIGISEDDLRKLFRPYVQIEAGVRQKGKGTGLGLSICRRIVELAGGDCGVDSEVGGGSTFWVELPMMATEEGPSVTSSSAYSITFSKPVASPALPGSVLSDADRSLASSEDSPELRPRVLLVEDSRTTVKMMRRMLTRIGCEHEWAEDGQAAVDRVGADGADAFDVILMDKEMPRMDGYDATAALRRMGVSCPIIGITANALHADRESFIAAGATHVLVKPIRPKMLTDVLAGLLGVPLLPARKVQELSSRTTADKRRSRSPSSLSRSAFSMPPPSDVDSADTPTKAADSISAATIASIEEEVEEGKRDEHGDDDAEGDDWGKEEVKGSEAVRAAAAASLV